MRKFVGTPIISVGVLTQALAAAPQQAAARSIDPVSNVCDTDAIAAQETARALLADVLFSLSPAEKRAIAGARIRLNMPTMKLAEYTATGHGAMTAKGNISTDFRNGRLATNTCAHALPTASINCPIGHAAVKTPQPHITPPRITTPK